MDHYKTLERAAKARETAKFFGGKALKGSAKQKAWAEDLRQEAITNITDDAVTLYLISQPAFQQARWWIDHRDQTPQQLEATYAEAAAEYVADLEAEEQAAAEYAASFEAELIAAAGLASVRIADIPADDIATRAISDPSHPATEIQCIEVCGARVRVFSIPSLQKQMAVCEHEGTVYQGYTACS